jgi:hypothetical protein
MNRALKLPAEDDANVKQNGDGFEHIPTGTFIQDGTLIEPVFDDSAYELQAVQNSLDVKVRSRFSPSISPALILG